MRNVSTLLKNEKIDALASLQPLPGLDALGYGFDVRDEYANPKSIKLPVIDLGPLNREISVQGKEYAVPSDITIDVHVINRSLYEIVSGKSIKEYRQSLNSNTKIEGSYNFFTGSLKVDFNMDEMKNAENEFSTVRNVIDLWTLNLPDIETLPVRQSAIDDINGITGLSPIEVLEKYGSHFIWQAVIGGRVDCSSSTDKLTFNQSFDLGVVAEMSYENLIGSISASNKTKYAQQITEFNENSSTIVKTTGGDPTLGARIANEGKKGFEDWAASVKTEPVMIDFTGNSLVPIWDLCSDESQKQKLKAAFHDYMAESSAPIEPDEYSVEVVFPQDMILAGSYGGSDVDMDLAVYRPPFTKGYRWIGHYAQGDLNPPYGTAAMIKELVPGSTAAPIGYSRVWDDHGSGADHDYSCWKPIPPQGYVALGYVMRLGVNDQNPPSGKEVEGLVCVHKSLVVKGHAGQFIWCDGGSGADDDCTIYKITGINDKGLDAGTFYGLRANNGTKPNPTHPQVYCFDTSKISIDR